MPHALLVEDDVFSSVILQEILLAWGCSVRMVYDGDTALRLVDSEQVFDIAVVDVLLARGTGLDVIRAIRRRTPRIGVIAIGSGAASHEAANEAGADVVLTKPISRTELSNLLTEMLK